MFDFLTRSSHDDGRLLRRTDQACLAVLLAASLFAIAWFTYCQGLLRGRLIDIELDHPARSVEFVLDPNTATWPEWSLLPGIGEGLARRVVESREQDGPFHSIDELRRVPGIGPKILEKIRPYLQMAEGADQGGSLEL